MAVFDMVVAPPKYLVDQADAISMKHFTVDTAEMDVVQEWVDYNPQIVTHAIYQGRVAGFFNVIPLTTECGEMFMRNEMLEEDLRVEHMVMHEALPHAKYAYVAAIAVDHADQYMYKQCAAALLATMADLFLNGYNGMNLRHIFANPTTFNGNKLVSRLGFEPVDDRLKSLKMNDIYAAKMTENTEDALRFISDRYRRFVGKSPWHPAP